MAEIANVKSDEDKDEPPDAGLNFLWSRAAARADSSPRAESSTTIHSDLTQAHNLVPEHEAVTSNWRDRSDRMHTVARRGFVADMGDDEGVA